MVLCLFHYRTKPKGILSVPGITGLLSVSSYHQSLDVMHDNADSNM